MKPKISKELIQKFERGDSVNDKELEILIDFYSIVQENLLLFGDIMYFATDYVTRQLNRMRDYQIYRAMKG